MSLPPAPSFTPASTLPRTDPPPPPLPGSNRNASNAHLPVPSAPPDAPSAAVLGQDGQTAPKPGVNVNGAESDKGKEKPTGKPVNVPSGSKRSIVVNARQVGPSFLFFFFAVGRKRVGLMARVPEGQSGVESYSGRRMGVWGYRPGLSSGREYVRLVS